MVGPWPDLRALDAFVSICETGSMSLAAARLGVSASAISQMVKILERQHGEALFDRDVRPARPTLAGEALRSSAQALLAQARQWRSVWDSRRRLHLDRLRLGCVDSFAATVGPSLVQGLSASARQLQLWSGLTPALNAQMGARALDLAVCTDPGATVAGVTPRWLLSEAWVLVLPRNEATEHLGVPIQTVRELSTLTAAWPLVRYSQRSVIGQQIDRYLKHIGVRGEARFEFDATDALLSMVASGLGWALCTPLCLWQSRAWLPQVRVLALPPMRLGRRDFFILSREAESPGLAEQVAHLSRQVIGHDTWPGIRQLLPELPADTLTLQDAPS
jgi:DNA-binding transcriptional LysR family regulator